METWKQIDIDRALIKNWLQAHSELILMSVSGLDSLVNFITRNPDYDRTKIIHLVIGDLVNVAIPAPSTLS